MFSAKILAIGCRKRYLDDFDELLLDVSLDHERPRVRRVDEHQRRVHRHLAVHREEPIDLVGQVDRVQRCQGHRRGDLERFNPFVSWGFFSGGRVLGVCVTTTNS